MHLYWEHMATNAKLAVLIDADNDDASVIQELLAEISRYGTATIKRAYGNWTTPQLQHWKEVLNTLAIQPIQQFNYTNGKNSSDSALIIDAMDVLHSKQVDGFCIVSSDSDFTRLATRIRESGLVVYGFGQRKTPPPFVAACDKFVYTEILKASTAPAPNTKTPQFPPLKPMLMAAIEASSRDDGWAPLGPVGSHITKNHSDFDARNYGFTKLSDLVRKQNYLEFKDVPTTRPDGVTHNNLHIRGKQK